MNKMATKTGAKWDTLWIFSFLLLLDTCLLTSTCQSVWVTNTDREGTPALHLLRATTWWGAAGEGCGGAGSHLYLPGGQVSREVTHLLQEDTPYWIGALENSRWIWTRDESPLYTSIGYSLVPPDPDIVITDNSPFKCHLHCHQETKTVFGLRGDECYCLSTITEMINNQDDLKRCNGSYEEFCGNAGGMSVYKTGVNNLVPHEDGECGYAERKGNTMSVLQDDGCDTKRFLACSKPVSQPKKCKASMCIQHKARPWYESSNVCDLLKVTTGNANDLRSILTRSSNRRPVTYWVGLKRRFSWRWINGSVVQANYEHLDDDDGCLSLSISRAGQSSPTVTFAWRPCSERYEAICQKVVPFSSTIPSDVGQTTSIPGKGGSSNMTSSDEITDVSDSDNTGAYVGVTITILIIVGVGIVAVLFLKRKEKFCFARSKNEKVGFETTSQNYDVNYYSSPSSFKRNTTQVGRQQSLQDNYSRPDEHLYSEPSEVNPSKTNKYDHVYVNDPQLNKLHSYNKLHDIPNRPLADGYDHVELQTPTVEVQGKDIHRPIADPRSPKDSTVLDDHHYLVLENENDASVKPVASLEGLERHSGTSSGLGTSSGHSQAPSKYPETSEEDPVYHVTDSGEGDSAILPQDYSLASRLQEPQERRGAYYSPLKFDKPEENVYSHIAGEESASSRPYSLALQPEQGRVDTKCNTDTEYLVPEGQSDNVDNVYSLAEEASSA